jgi:hypothetical protein
LAHFLNAEYDAGERCVECRGHPGCGAGQYPARLAARRETARLEHDARADLHGRTLTSHRPTTQKTKQGQHNFAEGDLERNEFLSVGQILELPCRDHLRNAAAL